MGNELAVRAILEQARAIGESRTAKRSLAYGIAAAGQSIGAGLAGLANKLQKQRERARAEQDIKNINLRMAVEEGQDIDESMLSPEQLATGGVGAVGTTPEGREYLQQERARALEMQRLDLTERSVALRERALDAQLAKELEEKDDQPKPVGTGIWRLVDKMAKGQALTPPESRIYNAQMQKMEEEDREPLQVSIPDNLAEEWGVEKGTSMTPKELGAVMQLGIYQKALNKSEDGTVSEKEIAEESAKTFNAIIELNELKFPTVSAKAMMTPGNRTALFSSLTTFGQEERRKQSAADLAEYRKANLQMRKMGMALRQAQAQLAISEVRGTAAEEELKAIQRDLQERNPEIMYDFSKPYIEVLKSEEDLYERYLKAIRTGIEAREAQMSAQPLPGNVPPQSPSGPVPGAPPATGTPAPAQPPQAAPAPVTAPTQPAQGSPLLSDDKLREILRKRRAKK